jgi:hypothetical protein
VRGDAFACALLSDRTVRCWGANRDGQLGDGTREDRPQPTLVSGAGRVVQIAAGARHACARLEDGSVLCWGANEEGQLGDGTRERRAAPAEVVDTHDAVDVVAAGALTCVRPKGQKSRCFGEGTWTTPETACALEPDAGLSCESDDAGEAFAPLRDAVGVSPWASAAKGCARLADGAVACWGDGAWAGVRAPDACVRPPVRVVRFDRAVPPECGEALADAGGGNGFD